MIHTEQSPPRPAHRMEEDELATWLPFIRLVQLLPQALDRTLRDETGINHAHYAILVRLALAGQDAPTMTELARIAGLSPSRLSHAVDSLASRGWVERTTCATDRRAQRPVLTETGRAALRQAAPSHVAQVRELVLDKLSADEKARLTAIASRLLSGVEAALGVR
ncbi:MarR family winged helix-turn-helix transcriptional regulator [Microbacterium sp. RD1]|uniref:MarR family winged helix-turn-helix transcriptional regulator n=1 Tax=Microbacterium sp. RD1 TaxID=3457313 RepID=UPI003FA59FDD